MRKTERLPYVELVSELNWNLCGFCKYNGIKLSCDDDIICEHPLEHKLPYQDCFDIVSDCWGFRPSEPIVFVADIVGVCLANGWETATWWEHNGKLLIAGR